MDPACRRGSDLWMRMPHGVHKAIVLHPGGLAELRLLAVAEGRRGLWLRLRLCALGEVKAHVKAVGGGGQRRARAAGRRGAARVGRLRQKAVHLQRRRLLASEGRTRSKPSKQA